MPVRRSPRKNNKTAAGAKAKSTRPAKEETKAPKVADAGKAKKEAPSKTKAKVADDKVPNLKAKVIMIDEAIRGKKNEAHIIAAGQLDDDVEIEKNGWKVEKESYEAELVKLVDDDGAKTAQSIQRLERKMNRAEKVHEGRLEELKLELAKKREESDKEAKRLNNEIEGLRKLRKKVVAEIDEAKKALE